MAAFRTTYGKQAFRDTSQCIWMRPARNKKAIISIEQKE